ncbi:MAG: hypothetical protein WA989_16820, partial [Henriciella sp.]|uniref:hypothetical protein n=1 Tax=Henriciella sp. TaxID=1968823 RepID=UPI003C78A4CC
DIARSAELEHFALWAQTMGAEHALVSEPTSGTAEVLRQLLRTESRKLSIVFRLSAEAALACHAPEGNGDERFQAANFLKEVQKIDLPAVELRLLEHLARTLADKSEDWAAAADAIRARERYATCNFSDSEVSDLMCAVSLE